MRIQKLKLENFRGFEELELDFPEGEGGLAVFVGENGSGKTSVLKAISYFFKYYTNILYYTDIRKEDELDGFILEKSLSFDIKKGENYFSNTITFNTLSNEFNSEIFIEESSRSINLSPPLDQVKHYFVNEDSNAVTKEEKKLRTLKNKLISQPEIIVYYNVDRFVADEPSLKAKDITQIKKIDAFTNNFSSNISFDDFFEWFRNTEDYENELIRDKNDYNIRLDALESIRKTLEIFLPKYNSPRVRRQPREQLVFKDNGHLLEIANLSHGERLTFAIVGDIIRRLSIANPSLKNPCIGKGLVLIDEIEQHLHPSWQRTIIFNLRKAFPNIQFIITTHSPQVLSNVQRENVFILEEFKLVKNTPYTYGRDSNSLLWDLFGVTERPEHTKKEFSRFYRLMDDPSKDEDTQALLNNLEEKYGKNDNAVMQARLHFEFMTR